MTNSISTDANSKNDNLTIRKSFIECWVHAHPEFDEKDSSRLYDELERKFPEISRGGHRGMVGRRKPWTKVDHECPSCGHEVEGVEAIKEAFGFRNCKVKAGRKTYVQSYCRTCRPLSKAERKRRFGNGERLNPVSADVFTNGPESVL